VNRLHGLRCCVTVSILYLTSNALCFPQILDGKQSVSDREAKPADNSSTGTRVNSFQEFYANKLLKGSVELSNELPQIPNNLRPGNKYPDSPSAGLHETETWLRIPEWLAGTWKSDRWVKDGGQIFFSEASLEDGFERDAEGQIWTREVFPYDLPENDSFKSFCDYEYGDEPQGSGSNHSVIGRSHYIVSSTDKSGIITRSWQEECLLCYSPNRDGTLNCESTVQLFDLNGHKYGEYKGKYQLRLVKPFAPATSEFVHKSFKKYLTENGLQRLIPTNLLDGKPTMSN